MQVPIRSVIVDARCLIQTELRYRGVGQHAAALLRGLRFFEWKHERPSIIGHIDKAAENIAPEHIKLFDEIVTRAPTRANSGDWFLNPSPMTADVSWIQTILTQPAVRKIAIFHDLIPLNHSNKYLSNIEARISYWTQLHSLILYNDIVANSQYTKHSLCSVTNISNNRVLVSGVALRPTMEPAENRMPLARQFRSHIVACGGNDSRKNIEIPIIAHARSRECQRQKVVMFVTGNYSDEHRKTARTVCVQAGGDPTLLVFTNHLTDFGLFDLLERAIVAIIASQDEGFSIPVIEASAAGTPAIVSDIPAHVELIANKCSRFPYDNYGKLSELLDQILSDPSNWEQARRDQNEIWRPFTVKAVANRFVGGLLNTRPVEGLAVPRVRRNAKPRIAVLTPLPPAQSGVADYSAAVFGALARLSEVHVFTDTVNPNRNPAFSSILPTGVVRHLRSSFDAVISIIGNSDHHLNIFNYLLEYGGASIVHDARLINFYLVLLGEERTKLIAKREGYEVDSSRLRHWLHHQEDLPTLFLSEVASASKPMIVHSPITADLIKELYNVHPVVLPFAQYREINFDDVGLASRAEARRRLGWPSNEIVICSFGRVAPDRAPENLIWAVKLLEDWGINVRLVFCGPAETAVADNLKAFARDNEVRSPIQLSNTISDNQTYYDNLVGCDCAVQLRTYKMGGLSGALNDCIAAAVPTVSNKHLANAMDAPQYIRRIGDDASPILLAEMILEIIRSEQNERRPIAAAAEYAVEHSPAHYSKLLLQALGLESGIEDV